MTDEERYRAYALRHCVQQMEPVEIALILELQRSKWVSYKELSFSYNQIRAIRLKYPGAISHRTREIMAKQPDKRPNRKPADVIRFRKEYRLTVFGVELKNFILKYMR